MWNNILFILSCKYTTLHAIFFVFVFSGPDASECLFRAPNAHKKQHDRFTKSVYVCVSRAAVC